MDDEALQISVGGGRGEIVLLCDNGVAAWAEMGTWCSQTGELAATHVDAYQHTPRPWEVVVRLADDATVQAANREFRHKDKPTNVLSFPNADDGLEERWTVGDILLAVPTVEREAETLGITVADHARHLLLHGLLHLVGYDHLTPTEANTMEELEIRLLAMLHIANPYQGEQE